MRRQFVLFCLSGTLAFAMDAGIVQALVSLLAMDPIMARIPSFACAVTFTWAFNRRYTFKPRAGAPLMREWRNYVLSQLLGLAVNFLVYSTLVLSFTLAAEWPVLAVAAGSCAGLLVNYLVAWKLIFPEAKA